MHIQATIMPIVADTRAEGEREGKGELFSKLFCSLCMYALTPPAQPALTPLPSPCRWPFRLCVGAHQT
jgi:hypothetical protein